MNPKFTLLTDTDLLNQPPVTWLVNSLLPSGGLVVLHGRPGIGKSFLALEVALAIATGRNWDGYHVEQGPTVYVAAGEGQAGIRQRVDAWKYAHGIGSVPGARFVLDAVQLHRFDEIDALCNTINTEFSRMTALTLIDTYARCAVGVEENSAKDVGSTVAGLDLLRRGTDGAVMAVHHSQKKGGELRGSSALFGAADAVWHLSRYRNGLTLECQKMKDGPEFKPVHFILQPVIDSCVLLAKLAKPEDMAPAFSLSLSQRKILMAFNNLPKNNGLVRAGEWEAASGVPKATFYRALEQFVKNGLVAGGDGQPYQLLPKGSDCLVSVSAGYQSSSAGSVAGITQSLPPLGGD